MRQSTSCPCKLDGSEPLRASLHKSSLVGKGESVREFVDRMEHPASLLDHPLTQSLCSRAGRRLWRIAPKPTTVWDRRSIAPHAHSRPGDAGTLYEHPVIQRDAPFPPDSIKAVTRLRGAPLVAAQEGVPGAGGQGVDVEATAASCWAPDHPPAWADGGSQPSWCFRSWSWGTGLVCP